jgi:hypothetical protein
MGHHHMFCRWIQKQQQLFLLNFVSMKRGSMGGDFSVIPISVAGENLWKWCPYLPGVLHKNADLNWTSFNVGFCFCNCHHMHFASEIQSQ